MIPLWIPSNVNPKPLCQKWNSRGTLRDHLGLHCEQPVLEHPWCQPNLVYISFLYNIWLVWLTPLRILINIPSPPPPSDFRGPKWLQQGVPSTVDSYDSDSRGSLRDVDSITPFISDKLSNLSQQYFMCVHCDKGINNLVYLANMYKMVYGWV